MLQKLVQNTNKIPCMLLCYHLSSYIICKTLGGTPIALTSLKMNKKLKSYEVWK